METLLPPSPVWLCLVGVHLFPRSHIRDGVLCPSPFPPGTSGRGLPGPHPAQVIALGASIGEHIASPAEKLLVPPLRLMLKDNGVKEEWAAVAMRCTSICRTGFLRCFYWISGIRVPLFPFAS